MSTPQILQADEMKSLLSACCKRGTPVTIRSMVDQTVHSANFQELNGDALCLHLQTGPGCTPPQSGLCCVIFCRDRKTYLFTTLVRQSESPSMTHVELELPAEMTMERRASIRVPLDGGLRVSVSTREGASAAGIPRNLSLSGIFVELEEPLELPCETWVTVELNLGQIEARLNGVVRRSVGQSYGLVFCAPPGEPAYEPPDALHHIYTLLRQRRLPRKLLKAAPRPSAGQKVAIPIGKST